MHVHMVGNGVAGSGGWLRLNGWHRWLAGFMVKQLGFSASVLDEDLEAIYAEHLLAGVRESSLDAIVLLAHEQVYDAGLPARRREGRWCSHDHRWFEQLWLPRIVAGCLSGTLRSPASAPALSPAAQGNVV